MLRSHYYVWISFQQYQESSFIPLDKIRVYVGSTVDMKGLGCSMSRSLYLNNMQDLRVQNPWIGTIMGCLQIIGLFRTG